MTSRSAEHVPAGAVPVPDHRGRVSGDPRELGELALASTRVRDWLGSEPEFHGYLRQGQTSGPDEGMGASTELIIGIASSGAATALARSLQVWLMALNRFDVRGDVAPRPGTRLAARP